MNVHAPLPENPRAVIGGNRDKWAAQHAPNSVHANPRRRIDLLDAPVLI